MQETIKLSIKFGAVLRDSTTYRPDGPTVLTLLTPLNVEAQLPSRLISTQALMPIFRFCVAWHCGKAGHNFPTN